MSSAEMPAHSASNPANGAQQSATKSNANGDSNLSKEEVGWYFVEQYYTTLSRDPNKLWLYYNKRSQHVSGIEEEKVPVCVGQKHIKDRIAEHDFADSKVRITNVDTQSSDENIMIQVLGDISTSKNAPRHFVQSFILSQQPNGYFVLNDIFRYIKEEVDEEPAATEPVSQDEIGTSLKEPAPTQTEENASLTNTEESVVEEPQAAAVDEKLESIQAEQPSAESTDASTPAEVNGTPAQEEAQEEPSVPAEPESEIAPAAEEPGADVVDEAAAATEDAAKEKKPVDPAPTPAPKESAPPAEAASAKPAAPKSWAGLVAASVPKIPAALKQAVTSVTSQPRASPAATESAPKAPASQPAQSSPTPQAKPGSASPAREGSPDSAGWQTAGADHTRKQSRVQNPPNRNEPIKAYVKNVTNATAEDFKKAMASYGGLEHADVDSQKNCAFLTFNTLLGFQAAVRANPHHIAGEDIVIEERKPRGPTPFGQRGGMRGGRGGRGGFGQERGRGNFTPRGGRGGAGPAPRGRGAPAAA